MKNYKEEAKAYLNKLTRRPGSCNPVFIQSVKHEVHELMADFANQTSKEQDQKIDKLQTELDFWKLPAFDQKIREQKEEIEKWKLEFDKTVQELAQAKTEIEDFKKAEIWSGMDVKPIGSESGDWDGVRTDFVLLKFAEGDNAIGRCYYGFIDGSDFSDWYDLNDFEIEGDITGWMNLPD